MVRANSYIQVKSYQAICCWFVAVNCLWFVSKFVELVIFNCINIAMDFWRWQVLFRCTRLVCKNVCVTIFVLHGTRVFFFDCSIFSSARNGPSNCLHLHVSLSTRKVYLKRIYLSRLRPSACCIHSLLCSPHRTLILLLLFFKAQRDQKGPNAAKRFR